MELETAAQYMPHQVPLPTTRVQSLLDSIDDCQDPNIAARRAAITIEHNRMHDDWEAAVAHLLPACPVAAKLHKKRKNAEVSGVGGALDRVGPKTGVEFRWYKKHELRALTQ